MSARVSLFLVCTIHLFLLSHGRPTSDDDDKSYVQHTCKNYEGRTTTFANWAEEDANAKSAKKFRKLLLTYLSSSLSDPDDIQGKSAVRILDAGCGPCRDVEAFAKGHISLADNSSVPLQAVGFDCAKGFIDQCQKRGLNAVVADFIGFWDLVPEDEKYDGIFSLAALFHLPKPELAKTLGLFHKHMNKHGVILSTIPMGNLDREMADGRWMIMLPEEKQKRVFEDAGFKTIYTEKGTIYGGNQWLVLVARKM